MMIAMKATPRAIAPRQRMVKPVKWLPPLQASAAPPNQIRAQQQGQGGGGGQQRIKGRDAGRRPLRIAEAQLPVDDDHRHKGHDPTRVERWSCPSDCSSGANRLRLVGRVLAFFPSLNDGGHGLFGFLISRRGRATNPSPPGPLPPSQSSHPNASGRGS